MACDLKRRATHPQALAAVKRGETLLRAPEGCTPGLALTMSECLSPSPKKRPPFNELDRRFSSMTPEDFASPAFALLDDVSAPASPAARLSSADPTRRRRSIANFEGKRATRTDSIMGQLFPPHVVEALLMGRKVPPERKEMITMYFRYACAQMPMSIACREHGVWLQVYF